MEKIKCIIVEDEPLAAEILTDYIAQVPFLKLSGVYPDAFAAMEGLQNEEPGVIFLDLHLPKLKGLDFLKTLTDPPQVIVTTAYRDYALDSYDLNVTDYLLKPINFNRFLTAVNKIKKRGTDPGEPGMVKDAVAGQKNIFVTIARKKIRISPDDILFIESRREYINIMTVDNEFVVKMPLSEIEMQLDKDCFLRLHRSFIVAVKKVTAYKATQVEINGHTIPVGRYYKEATAERMVKEFNVK